MTVKLKTEAGDDNVASLAVKALAAAQLRAKLSGRPIVLVQGKQLVRWVNGRSVVLKTLPGRVKTHSLLKSSASK